MDNGPFFALLRSFTQLSPMQLERAQEHLRDHLQRHLLHQALAGPRAGRHGGRGQEHVPLVPALIALDLYGRESDTVLLNKCNEQLEPALLPLLKRSSILCSDGNQSYIKLAEKGEGIIHKRLITKAHGNPPEKLRCS